MNRQALHVLEDQRRQAAGEVDRLAEEFERWPAPDVHRRLEAAVRRVNQLDVILAAARSSAA